MLPSTDLKKYKLIISDKDATKTIHLNDKQATAYRKAREENRFTFFWDDEEYLMKDCLLKKIENVPTQEFYCMKELKYGYKIINDENVLVYRFIEEKLVSGKWIQTGKEYFGYKKNRKVIKIPNEETP